MDYNKLIENFKQLEFVAYNYNINGEVLGMGCAEFESVMADAALAIETLRADLARVTAERDAAVEYLEEIMFKGGRNIDTCKYCKTSKCYGRGGRQVCNPAWRGTGAVIEKNWVDHKGTEGPEGKED